MGLGDVKFMGAIGAFLGWQAVVFSLMVSSIIGSLVGVSLIVLRKREWSSRLPYGPYIALAAAIWLFGRQGWSEWWSRDCLKPGQPTTALRLVAQRVVHQHQGGHGLDHRHGPRQHTRIVAAPAFQRGVLEVSVHRVLLVHDGGDRFERHPKVDGLRRWKCRPGRRRSGWWWYRLCRPWRGTGRCAPSR